MPSDQWLSDAYGGMGSPYPFEGTGSIVIWTDPPFQGATFGIVDAPGEPRTYYGNEAQWPSLDLGATTFRGWGGFIEVVPAEEVELEIGGTADRCTLTWGWPGDNNTIRVPVRAGYSTHVSVTCQSADASQTEGGS
jgi:hypothetical protein